MGLISKWNKIVSAFKQLNGTWFFTLWSNNPGWSKKTTHNQKLRAVLENPAALYIFLLLPELFSMGRFKLTKNEKDVEEHPLLNLLSSPNPMQTGEQFLWDYMFMRKLGTANLYVDSQTVSPENKMYFLNGDCIEWPKWFEDHSKKIILSKSLVKQIKEKELVYKTGNDRMTFKYKKLLQFFDISNGLEGWFSSPSRVDALYKIIDNSEKALASKNINADFSSKFVVSGKVDIQNTSQLPMQSEDKESLREAMRSKENIFPTKTAVSINRFIDQPKVLEALDEAFMKDAFLIGKMLNIPKDVIEMLGSATYENQEKARAVIISYCIQPDANDFCSGLLKYFGLDEYKLELNYDHLPFVQVFEKDRAETLKLKSEAFMKLVDSGADPNQVAELLDFQNVLTEFGEPNQRAQSSEVKLEKVI